MLQLVLGYSAGNGRLGRGAGGFKGTIDNSLCGVAIYRLQVSTASKQLIGEITKWV